MVAFSLAFLMVGMPIIYTLREFLPPEIKFIITYSFIAFLLLYSINYKNLLNFKFYSSQTSIISIGLGILLVMFILYAYLMNAIESFFSQFIYILIIIVVYIMLLTRKSIELKKFPFYFLIISSCAQLFSILLTPIDINYWLLHGGAFYVGDTNNSNLTSFISLLNIYSIIYYLSNYKLNLYYKFLLFMSFGISLFLYFLSFSKSAIFGFILIIVYFLIFNKNALKIIYNKKILIVLIITSIYLIFFSSTNIDLISKVNETINSINALFHGGDSHANSGAARYENYSKMFLVFQNINFFYAKGIFLTQTDNAIFQGFTDLGYFMGVYILFFIFIIPMYLIIHGRKIVKKYNNKHNLYNLYNFSIAIYIFNIPNIFFHATPYAISIWLPILLLYKVIPLK